MQIFQIEDKQNLLKKKNPIYFLQGTLCHPVKCIGHYWKTWIEQKSVL